MKIHLIIKSFLYFILGLLVILLRTNMLPYLSLVIASVLFADALEDLIYMALTRKVEIYKAQDFYLPVGITILSIIMFVEYMIPPLESNIEFVCTIWGCVTIIQACRNITEAIASFKGNKKSFAFHLAKGSIAIAFAFMLMIDPAEHVLFHLVILGSEFIFEGLTIFTRLFHKKPKLLMKDEKLAPKIEQIEELIDAHPSKSEEILEALEKVIEEKKAK